MISGKTVGIRLSLSEKELEVDGANRQFRDKLLDELVGNWDVTGKAAGELLLHSCTVDWILNHQFLRIHFLDVGSKSHQRKKAGRDEHAPYEAMVFVGYDNMSERYVVHWLDIFGGRFSETLGYGKRKDRNSIRFLFEGGTGPLHNTFTWNPRRRTWSMVIDQKDAKGKWTRFASESLQRIS